MVQSKTSEHEEKQERPQIFSFSSVKEIKITDKKYGLCYSSQLFQVLIFPICKLKNNKHKNINRNYGTLLLFVIPFNCPKPWPHRYNIFSVIYKYYRYLVMSTHEIIIWQFSYNEDFITVNNPFKSHIPTIKIPIFVNNHLYLKYLIKYFIVLQFIFKTRIYGR